MAAADKNDGTGCLARLAARYDLSCPAETVATADVPSTAPALERPLPSIDRFAGPQPVRVLVFTSPNAGSGSGREQIPLISQLAREQGVESAVLHSVDDLRQAVNVEGEDAVVIAAGGDGTIALAAKTVGPEVPLVPMPLGTENLLARHFGHSAVAAEVWRTVRHGPERRLDAGLANGRPFLIMATCGFDAEVTRAMHLTRRGHIRRFSYFLPILRAIRRYRFPPIRIDVDGESPRQARWCMVFNLPLYATNLEIEPDADGEDGQLDLIGFQKGSVLSGLRYLFGIKSGRHLRFEDVTRRKGSTFVIESDQPVPYQVDGDYGGHLPLRIETLPRHVQLLIPPG